MKIEYRVGTHIRELREDKGWTQEQLAEITSLSVRTIQRAERDLTNGREALMAIANAFEVNVRDLRRKYWIAERQPLQALAINKASDFFEAIRRAHHFFSYRTLAELHYSIAERAETLVRDIFADIWAMSPDEPELVGSWVRSIAEPFEQLQELGLAIFSIQECRDVFLKGRNPGERLPLENCTYGYFLVIPRHATFHLGGKGSGEPLHSFTDHCSLGVESLHRVLKEPLLMGLFATALHAIKAEGGTDRLTWCDTCFPADAAGNRIGYPYLQAVTGLTPSQLQTIIASHDDSALVGLA